MQSPCRGYDWDEGVTRRWVSLLDMATLFDLPELTLLLWRLCILEEKYRERQELGFGNSPLTQPQSDILDRILHDALVYCQKVGFGDASVFVATLISRMAHSSERYALAVVGMELTNLHSKITEEIYKRKFVLVSEELSKYLESTDPLGKAVADSFPSATADLVEAGNCLALGCNPAVVFHLMRAAEVALWELGRDRQIPLAKSGKIEFAQWGDIIKELEDAVKQIQVWPNSRSKEEAHKFYNGALSEIRSFNDGWRRHSAHPRPYMPKMETDEALALWGHVSRFMNTLAARIKEGQYTLLIWQ